MVQPYLHEVDEHGEAALLFLDGRFSHAMRKGPLLTAGMGLVEGLFAHEETALRDPSVAERELADAVLAAVPPHLAGDLFYALATKNGSSLCLHLYGSASVWGELRRR